ncbi:hypothetical protein A0H81_04452 [Grifola frondosa]|uniref:Uncharacterized protein n=1 Tax=Grifola frondosa TaxID=5627 RepID=A0A1C7MFN0_GRIFR|nr:hypothetical protein A0H81_04452 [Grifola frondosa]
MTTSSSSLLAHPILHRPQARAPSSRLVAVQTDSFDRLKISDDPVEQDYKGSERSEKESASPRASPRSQLPSEALEEFLSILHPSAFLSA